MKDVIEYRSRFICKNDYGYIVKDAVDSSYNLHHGMFDNVEQAKAHINRLAKRRQDNKEVKELHERLTTIETENERLTRMIAEMKMVIDCNKCENRGKVNGLSQEIFCDGCIHVDRWKKDYFSPQS